jgi:hypothetical protein
MTRIAGHWRPNCTHTANFRTFASCLFKLDLRDLDQLGDRSGLLGAGRHLDRNRERGRSYARSERGREVNQKAVARWQAANPEKIACHRELRRAVRRGEVTRPLACEVIGCGSAGKLHGHHVNYRRPRDVIFACPRHHEAIHHDGPQPLKANVRTQRKYARPPGLSTPQ